MDVMDRLYELYVAEFEEFTSRARRIAHECASPDPDKLWARQFSPQEFRAYLSDASRKSQAKRSFLRRLLRGNEGLESELPSYLVALLGETAIRPPHFLGVQQRSLR
jgi:hypothetical protein